MPLISSATVASFAAAAVGIMRATSNNPRAARTNLIFVKTISTTSVADYTAANGRQHPADERAQSAPQTPDPKIRDTKSRILHGED